MATAVAPPATPKTTTSVDPLYTQALAQAKATIGAQIQPIADEQSASDASYLTQEQNATSEGQALSGLLANIGPAVNQTYQTAGQNQELAAAGFSHGLQDALNGNTNNLNSMLSKLGAPVQLDSHATQAGDVLYALGGYNPGVAMNQTGAARAAQFDELSADAILHGQENKTDLINKAAAADQTFQQKIAEMAGNLPGDTLTNYKALQTMALNDKKLAAQIANDKVNAAYKTAEVKLAQAKYSTSVSEFNAKQSLAYAKLSQQTLNQNRDYQVKLAQLKISGQKLQQTILTNSFKAANGGLTQAQVAKYVSEASAIAMQGANGTTKYSTVSGKTTTSKVGRVPYFEALGNILKKGIPVQVALDALDRAYPTSARPTPAALARQLGPLDPQAVQQVAAALTTQKSGYAQMTGQIPDLASLAAKYNLDPEALLAVSAQEGLGGGIGDSGTSFGPFQMHVGGALPAQIAQIAKTNPQAAQTWAWSPAGVEYALSQIAKVASGLKGAQAVQAIVTRFERPANIPNEIQGALNDLPVFGG